MFLDDSRGVIKVSGGDKLRFLQGLITNDLGRLEKNDDAIYTALLSPKGRYLFDFFVVKQDEDLYLVGQKITDLYTKIKPYKLRLDVQLDILESLKVYGVFEDGFSVENEVVFRDPRHPKMPCWILSEYRSDTARIAQEYHRRRFEYTIPEGHELEVDKSIILEWGFERLNGISFTKGCYMGQELMSRTKHVGEIRKQLMTIKFSQELSPQFVDQDVLMQGQPVGSIKAVFEDSAMAMVRLTLLPQDLTDSHVAVDGLEGTLCPLLS